MGSPKVLGPTKSNSKLTAGPNNGRVNEVSYCDVKQHKIRLQVMWRGRMDSVRTPAATLRNSDGEDGDVCKYKGRVLPSPDGSQASNIIKITATTTDRTKRTHNKQPSSPPH